MAEEDIMVVDCIPPLPGDEPVLGDSNGITTWIRTWPAETDRFAIPKTTERVIQPWTSGAIHGESDPSSYRMLEGDLLTLRASEQGWVLRGR